MKKLFAILLAVVLAFSLASCFSRDAVLDEARVYEVTGEVHSLDISISAADFRIEEAEEFSVESNLKYLSVSEMGGRLTIVDNARGNSDLRGATLTLYVPSGTVFEDVDIETGAAKMTADTLSANTLELKFGAGEVHIESLNAITDVEIEGGACDIDISGGTLNGLTLEMGVGSLDLTAALVGECELEFGVGAADITLVGTKEDYRIDVDKGLGSITVDGESFSGIGDSGNGNNHIEISGGVGAIEISFGN